MAPLSVAGRALKPHHEGVDQLHKRQGTIRGVEDGEDIWG
jgi:hypothetical protein